MTILERLEQTTSNESVLLLEFIPQDARLLFWLIKKNRDHLSQWGDRTSEKYPDFESVLKSIVSPKNPSRIRLGIWCDGTLAGTINLTPRIDKTYTARIGYWVGSEFGGIGLATIATRAMIEYCRRLTFVDQLIADARIENIASQKVLKKAGLVETHRDEKHVHFAVSTES